jgi:hypothetical protein
VAGDPKRVKPSTVWRAWLESYQNTLAPGTLPLTEDIGAPRDEDLKITQIKLPSFVLDKKR